MKLGFKVQSSCSFYDFSLLPFIAVYSVYLRLKQRREVRLPAEVSLGCTEVTWRKGGLWDLRSTVTQAGVVDELVLWVRSVKVIKKNNGTGNCSIMGNINDLHKDGV